MWTIKKRKAKSTEDDLYKKITSYCAREVNFEEQAKKDGLIVADTREGHDGIVWNKRSGSVSYLGAEFKKLGLSSTSVSGKEARERCEKVKKDSKHNKSIYEAYKKICIKLDSDK